MTEAYLKNIAKIIAEHFGKIDDIVLKEPIFRKTTGLTGLSVHQNPRRSLAILYGKIMRILQKLPANYPYRLNTETLVTERAKIVNNFILQENDQKWDLRGILIAPPEIATSKMVEKMESLKNIEEKISAGQLEELIMQANEELKLARNILEWRSWEPMNNKIQADQWLWPAHN